MAVTTLIFLSHSAAHARIKISVKVKPKARQKLVRIEKTTRDSAWLMAAADSVHRYNAWRAIQNEETDSMLARVIESRLRKIEIIPSDTLVRLLGMRIKRYHRLQELMADSLIEATADGMLDLTGKGDPIDRRLAELAIKEENRDRTAMIKELNRISDDDETNDTTPMSPTASPSSRPGDRNKSRESR